MTPNKPPHDSSKFPQNIFMQLGSFTSCDARQTITEALHKAWEWRMCVGIVIDGIDIYVYPTMTVDSVYGDWEKLANVKKAAKSIDASSRMSSINKKDPSDVA